MTWLLDACILIRAEDAGRLSELLDVAATFRIALAEEVWFEVADPVSRRPRVLAAARRARATLDASNIHVESIPLGGPEAALYAALRQGRTSPNDAGECASVALASCREHHVFVTAEKGAVVLGVHELGERVMTLPWFLRRLVEAHALSAAAASEIRERDRMSAPAWWADWIRTATAGASE
ncbi:MAG: hypothetical protein ACI8PZ_004779 [Myxococcota bacterium]|jgi:hypothetical protein